MTPIDEKHAQRQPQLNDPCGIETQPSSAQSHRQKLASFASLLAISGTFNSLSKVLFIFPSQYLFAIGLPPVFSLRWNLPPALSCNPKQLDSVGRPSRGEIIYRGKRRDCHPLRSPVPREFTPVLRQARPAQLPEGIGSMGSSRFSRPY